MASNGVVLFKGASVYNGAPLVVIMTGVDKPSQNRKTGASYQVFILADDVSPTEASRTDASEANCGDCVFRHGACYVRIEQAPLAVWTAYKRGVYPEVDWSKFKLRQEQFIRFGAYGDPALVAFDLWEPLFSQIKERGVRHTGYTHAWRYCDQRYAGWLQASADHVDDLEFARSRGWRTFRVRAENEPLMEGEFICPASTEYAQIYNKKKTCAQCLACDGKRSNADFRGSAAIIVHGTKKHANAFVRLTVNKREQHGHKT
jgi:hypothetical protein